MQPVRLAIPDREVEVGLVRSPCRLQPRKGFCLGFEADDVAGPDVAQEVVGWFMYRIGPDIDDGCQP